MNRPKIICHMMASVDGRIVVQQWTTPSGTDKSNLVKSYGMIHTEVMAEAIIEGRKTVQEDFVHGMFEYEKHSPASEFITHKANHTSQRFFVVVDPQGKIFYEVNNIRGNDVITVLSEQVSDEYLSHLREKEISYLFAGSDGRDMEKMLEILKQDFYIETALLQGGGIINGAFLKAGLIDELSLMIYPGIDGLAGSAAVFDFFEESDRQYIKDQSLELTSCRSLDNGVVWLSYRIHTQTCLAKTDAETIN